MIDYNKFISCRRYNTRTIRIASEVAQTPTLPTKTPMIGLNGLSINQLGKESNFLKIGSQTLRVNTHRAMEKQKISKIPKAN